MFAGISSWTKVVDTCKITKDTTINPKDKMNIRNFQTFDWKPQMRTSWWITGKATESLMSSGSIIWDPGMFWRQFLPSRPTVMEQSGPGPTQVANGETRDYHNWTERGPKHTGREARIAQPLQFESESLCYKANVSTAVFEPFQAKHIKTRSLTPWRHQYIYG